MQRKSNEIDWHLSPVMADADGRRTRMHWFLAWRKFIMLFGVWVERSTFIYRYFRLKCATANPKYVEIKAFGASIRTQISGRSHLPHKQTHHHWHHRSSEIIRESSSIVNVTFLGRLCEMRLNATCVFRVLLAHTVIAPNGKCSSPNGINLRQMRPIDNRIVIATWHIQTKTDHRICGICHVAAAAA